MAKTDEIRVRVHSYGPGRPLALVYFDQVSGRKVAKSARTSDPKEAERAAGELEKQLQAGGVVAPARITWAEFRQRYEAEKLASLAPGTGEAARAAFAHVERVLRPDRLVKVTAEALSRFAATLRTDGLREATIARHLRHLKAAFRWAARIGLLAKAPEFDISSWTRGRASMKGRPITGEEFERLLATVPKVRPLDSSEWVRFLRGLWLSGLRVSEAMALSWDLDSTIAVDWVNKRLVLRIRGEAQKSGKDEILPVVPDLAAFLLETPEPERVGPVFRLLHQRTGRPFARNEVCRIVAQIGREARVVTRKEEGRNATAHDLRRSFGSRWARRVTPSVLKKLMRHSSVATTETYYVDLDAGDLAADLFARFPVSPLEGAEVGNTSGNNGPKMGVIRGG